MLEFETTLFSPSRIDDQLSEFTIAEAIRGVMADDLEAERMIRFGFAPYQHLLVAHQPDRFLGFQLVDYDPYEMDIELGRKEMNPKLTPDEKVFVAKSLSRIALNSYEELF